MPKLPKAPPERITLTTACGAQTLECCKRGLLRGGVPDRAVRLRELIERDIVLWVEGRCPFEYGHGLRTTVERRQRATESDERLRESRVRPHGSPE